MGPLAGRRVRAMLGAAVVAASLGGPVLASASPAGASTTPEPTAVTLFENHPTRTYGSETTETFTVFLTGQPSHGNPIGKVSIMTGATAVATANLVTVYFDGGGGEYSVTLTPKQLAPGPHSLTATFTPTPTKSSSTSSYSYTASTSTAPVSFTVNTTPEPTAVTLFENHPTRTYGSETTETFTVFLTGQPSHGNPIGKVSIMTGATAVATANLVTVYFDGGGGEYSVTLTPKQLAPGPHSLTATFTPTPTKSSSTSSYSYTASTSTTPVSFTVNKVTPTITWATPASITYGTKLGGTQLDAKASVTGAFAYTPPSGTVLQPGTHTLTVTFTPTTRTTYASASKTVVLKVVSAVSKPPPTITSLSRASGPATGGTKVTITGTGFSTVSNVKFGTTTAKFTVKSSTQILATSPPHASGTVKIAVTAAGGTSPTTVADLYTFTVPAPGVAGISPASGPPAGGTTVTVSGSGLTGATKVYFGSKTGRTISVNAGGTQLTVKSPTGTSGTSVAVRVMTPGGESPTVAADMFTYGPIITSLSRTSGPPTGGTKVTITGKGLTTVVAHGVKFGTTTAKSFTIESDTQIVVTSPAHAAGQVRISVKTSAGTTPATNNDLYTYT